MVQLLLLFLQLLSPFVVWYCLIMGQKWHQCKCLKNFLKILCARVEDDMPTVFQRVAEINPSVNYFCWRQ